ncbi:MAG: cation-translocating P-type ATPase [Crenarchaeota archaeon]|nr:cation-translocating P-type ATPase [Thermoproteota archaeon]MCR8472006.1 cation-translocating P-type ATPase [Thermoproteota archaeon]
MEKATFRVEGMTCVNCARAMEITLKRLKGIKKVEVSFPLGKVYVEFEEEFLGPEEIIKVIEESGYRVVEIEKKRTHERKILFLSFMVSIAIMVLMFFHHSYSLYIQASLSILIQIVGGLKFYKGAYIGLKSRIGNLDLLVALGTTSALFYSLLALFQVLPGDPFFETNAFLLSFVRLGKYIEEKTKGRALALLKELFALQTAKVRVLTSKGEREVPVSEVFPGDIILLKPGDLVPLDGEVEEGALEVEESMVTGESSPIFKKKGDSLISGSLVLNGFAKMRVKTLLEGSYISMILNMIEEAIKHKPRLQRLADRVSHYLVQIIVLLSILVFFFWYFIKGSDLSLSFHFALAVLVVSCPCAFGLAVPLAISVGLVRAYKKGLLIKDPSTFEKVKDLDILILDKTGTLTKGKPKVTEFISFEDSALRIAYSLALISQHPYSKAIVEYAKALDIDPFTVGECREVVGVGIFCGEYFLGRDPSGKGLILKRGDKVLAEIRVEDELREEAEEIIAFLQKRGIKVVLSTGDTKERAEELAKRLGLECFYAEVKPEDKLRLVEEFQRQGFKVGMVGDGLNDAPALTKADLSFVMAEGVELSKRVGDVVLLSGLKGIKVFMEISTTVRKRIWENLFWAFIYNLIGIPIAGGLFYSQGIILKPEIAGLMMALSSISVVLNSLRK